MIIAFAAILSADPAVRDPAAAEIVIVRGERLVPKTAQTGDVVITAETLNGQTGVRLDEALRLVPGAGLFRRTPSGPANATIQGLSLRPVGPNGAGRALVMLDGIPQNDPFGGWVYWGRYDPLFLESVTIARGGGGAGFGPLALTGSIDLREARGGGLALNLSAGSFASRHAAARQSYQAKGGVFTAMASYDRSDGAYALSAGKRGPVDVPLDYQTASVSLVADIVRSNGSWSFRTAAFSEAKSAGLIDGNSAAAGLDVSAARRWQGSWGQARVIVYAQGRDFNNRTIVAAPNRATGTPTLDQIATPTGALGISLEGEGSAQTKLPRITLEWRRANGQSQELFRFVGSDFTRTRLAGGQQDLVGLGLSLPRPLTFGALPWQVNTRLRLDNWTNTRGVRREADRASGNILLNERTTTRQGSEVSGNVSLTAGATEISLYRSFRPPTLNELHRPFRLGNDVTEANSGLDPETLVGIDLAWRFTRSLEDSTIDARMTLYANRLEGPITNVTLGVGPGIFPRAGFVPAGGAYRERRNAGSIEGVGLEVSLGWRARFGGPSVQASAQLNESRVEGGQILPQLTGKRPAQSPSWSGIITLTTPMRTGEKLHLSLRGESARFDDDLNTRTLPAYGALDVRYDHKLGANKWASLSIENALNTGVATARSGDGLVSFTQGRTMRLGLTLANR
jgi:TonB-dependent Receptor Plug Domain